MEQELPLRDIHLPDPISWWPLAPGWWVLLVLFIVLILILFWLLSSHANRRKNKRLRSIVKQELIRLQQIEDDKLFVEKLSALLKGVAIERYGADVAGLSGEKWLRFLDTHWTDNVVRDDEQNFRNGIGQILATAPYQKQVDIDRQALLQLASEWLLINGKRRSS